MWLGFPFDFNELAASARKSSPLAKHFANLEYGLAMVNITAAQAPAREFLLPLCSFDVILRAVSLSRAQVLSLDESRKYPAANDLQMEKRDAAGVER
jgi:hypothetical protein